MSRIDDETACVVVQYPDILGRISDLSAVAEAATPRARPLHGGGGNTELSRWGRSKSPGEMGAGYRGGSEGQSLGVGLQFGGALPWPVRGCADPKHVRQNARPPVRRDHRQRRGKRGLWC